MSKHIGDAKSVEHGEPGESQTVFLTAEELEQLRSGRGSVERPGIRIFHD